MPSNEEPWMRFFLGFVGEILQIAFAGRGLGCDDHSLDAAAAQRLDDACAKIGCRADVCHSTKPPSDAMIS
jgi:hypothetical protein